jgi:hypothetical protein
MAYRQGLTNKGLALFAEVQEKILTLEPGAGAPDLYLTRISVGRGVLAADADIAELETLIEPVTQGTGTSTTPVRTDTTVDIMVEYRNDMNGGIAEGFTLSELGIYAYDPDEAAEILLYYLALNPGMPVAAYEDGVLDGHRFGISFAIAGDVVITAAYPLTAYMTAEDVTVYIEQQILPGLQVDLAAMIAAHDGSGSAHPGLRHLIEMNQADIQHLMTQYENDVKGLNWRAWFDKLSGLTVTGVWNQALERMEF